MGSAISFLDARDLQNSTSPSQSQHLKLFPSLYSTGPSQKGIAQKSTLTFGYPIDLMLWTMFLFTFNDEMNYNLIEHAYDPYNMNVHVIWTVIHSVIKAFIRTIKMK